MRNLIVIGMAALFLTATLSGCSKSNSITLDANGKHPGDWVSKHAGFFRELAGAIDDPAIARSSACVECHGTDLKGGTSKVSCFSQGLGAATCHFHPVGFAAPASHGAVAKGAPAFNSGMDSCRGCHGSGFNSGLLSPVSCFPCHGVNAPHAANWALSATSKHSDTNQDNAAACAQCHAGGNLLTNLQPPPPQPAGTPPGCFNATLCHGQIGHPAGWIDPAQHGLFAKSQPGSDKGFTSCQLCHGQNFAGGGSGVSCFTANRVNGACHIRNGQPVNAPHAALPWRGAAPSPTHTSTVDDAQGLNAGVCAQCHLRGANLRTPILASYASGTPGCFNSTLCHGQTGHPLGWADPSQHGATGKSNLTFCQTCHADKPTGGAGSNPRFNVALGRLVNGCEDCHAPLTAHPPVLQIPAVFGTINNPDPLGTPWFRHRTATNFVDVCDRCHGVNLAGGTGPGCQSCHVAALPTTTINSADPCSSCHSNPPIGTTYPNINRNHGSHKFVNAPIGGLCAECHSGLGSGTLDHFLRAKNIRLGLVNPATQTAAQANAVSFGGVLSRANGASPAYAEATQTCSGTYCHGATLVGGTNKSPRWDQADYLNGPGCGVCHGFPPANTVHSGFTSATRCDSCHADVNATNDGFTIAGQSQHINGTIDVTGTFHLVPFFNHNDLASATCMRSNGGCHNTGTGAIDYPNVVDAVTGAPDCRSCHTLADPLGAGNGLGNCRSCHGTGGTADTAPPTGTTFPNIRGTNQDARHPNHNGSLCGDCHFGVDFQGRTNSAIAGAAGSGSGLNHGPNKTMLTGTVQTNSVQTVIGITTSSPRGSGATCLHGNLPNNNCHDGPSTSRTWTTQ